jgi:hypothetical protein
MNLTIRFAIPALMLAMVACGDSRKSLPAPPPPQQQPQPEKPAPSISAPASVPDVLKQRVASEWPVIQDLGEQFMVKFKELEAARAKDDRTAMTTAAQQAGEIYERLGDMWAALYYSVDDYDEKTADLCREWLRTYDRKVKVWEKRAKAAKEFSGAG